MAWNGRDVNFVISSDRRLALGDRGALLEVLDGIDAVFKGEFAARFRAVLSIEGVEGVIVLDSPRNRRDVLAGACLLLKKFPLTEVDPLAIIRHAFEPFVSTGSLA